MKPVLQYGSLRAQKARFAERFRGAWLIVVYLLIALSILGGIVLLLEDNPLGWLAASFAGPLAMIAIWWRGDLLSLPARLPARTIDDVLASDVLGRLPRSPSPRQIAEVVGSVRAGQFLAVREGISGTFLVNIASEDPNDTSALWEAAIRVQERTNSPKITGSLLAAEIIEQFPEYESLLASLRILMVAFDRGFRWY